MVQAGRFRQDLLYRIRVARVRLPALRDRREDIPLLSQAFLAQSRAAIGKVRIRGIAETSMQVLLRYGWPGNVRELKAVLEYALIHCRGEELLPHDLPPELLEGTAPVPSLTSQVTAHTREQFQEALVQARGKRAQAAKILGVSRSTFYRRLREFDLQATD